MWYMCTMPSRPLSLSIMFQWITHSYPKTNRHKMPRMPTLRTHYHHTRLPYPRNYDSTPLVISTFNT